MFKIISVRMLENVEDANEHLKLDANGSPMVIGGVVATEQRVDSLTKDGVYPLPDYQALNLIEHGHAVAV